MNALNIIELNVCSIISLQRRHCLNSFITQHNPDILLLNETRLRNSHKVHFKNYTFIRSDKTEARTVGTGVILRENIKYDRIDTSHWNMRAIECTAILVHTSSTPMCLVSGYRNPLSQSLVSEDIEAISDICLTNNWTAVIAGDFNAKHPSWNNTTTCLQGRALAQWLYSQSIARQIRLERPADPTYYKGAYSSTLDLFIVSDSVNIIRAGNTNTLKVLDYDSDHRAVQLQIQLQNRIQRREYRHVLNYQCVNWSHFRRQLDLNIRDLHIPQHKNMTEDDINTKLEELNAKIFSTMTSVIPSSTINPDTQLTLPQDILDLIRQKKCMRRRLNRNRQSPTNNQLRVEINLLSKIIDERLILFHKDHWTSVLQSIKIGPTAFKKIKAMCKLSTHKQPTVMINNTTGISTTQPAQIANILAKNYADVHLQNDAMGSIAFNNYVTDEVALFAAINTPRFTYNIHSPADSSIFSSERHLLSVDSLKNIIKNRPNKKSAGNDAIPTIVLRKLSNMCIAKITTLFNHMYNICYFPTAWKQALVIPICKKNMPENNATSYRPISLLPSLGKIYEKALKNEIDKQCEELQILPDDQFGFRPERSTTQPLVILRTDVGHAFNNRTPTIACSTDINKAFDTVWKDGLIFKMRNKFGFSDHICRCIYNYLSNRTFRVKTNDTLSTQFEVAAGVPQGGVLSAMLYILYIADMPAPPVHLQPIRRLQYADDMLIYVSAKNILDAEQRLNDYIHQIVTFFQKWKIKINPAKCEAIVFKGPCKRFGATANRLHNLVTVIVNGQIVMTQPTIKYLGVTFTKNLSCIPHVNHTMAKINRAYFGLKPVLRILSGLGVNLKLLCYKQLIRPIILYGFPSWFDVSSHQMERIRRIERVCIRACTNTTRYDRLNNSELYKLADINRIDRELTKRLLNFLNKNTDHCPIIRRCFDFDADHLQDARTFYKPPYYMKLLQDRNLLLQNGSLMFYHRRFHIRDEDLGPVYNARQ